MATDFTLYLGEYSSKERRTQVLKGKARNWAQFVAHIHRRRGGHW